MSTELLSSSQGQDTAKNPCAHCDIEYDLNLLAWLKEQLANAWNAMKALFESILDFIIGVFKSIVALFKSLIDSLVALYKKLHDLIISLFADHDSCASRCKQKQADKDQQDKEKKLTEKSKIKKEP